MENVWRVNRTACAYYYFFICKSRNFVFHCNSRYSSSICHKLALHLRVFTQLLCTA
uniref:Uncharacterized protein n=1 Tax=Anguilla anguilla TaxID=7936 RepID=A0A0E9S880_ANGAN